jgi:hypothetical protein
MKKDKKNKTTTKVTRCVYLYCPHLRYSEKITAPLPQKNPYSWLHRLEMCRQFVC